MNKTFGKILHCFVFSMFVVTCLPVFVYGQDGYVGSKTCGMCHSKEKKLSLMHGHSKMLIPVENATAPEGVDVTPPVGMEWKDISYLIGGYNIYARFLDSKGFVVTGTAAQWSLTGKTHSAFDEKTPPGTMKYDCISCHVVGWKESGSYDNGVKNTLPGIPGAWFENSVGCEACHGPGSEHIVLKDLHDIKSKNGDLKIKVDKSAESCGKCHKRTDNENILLVSDDLLNSRQQYSELMRSKKAKFKITCVACHEPHSTSAGHETDIDGLNVRKCESCHTGKFKKEIKLTAMQGLKCENCHMPLAARGAYDTMVKDYHKGDTHSHLFGISVDPAYKLNDGTMHASLTNDGLSRLTVEMVCYSCHKAGISHDMTREQMLEMAKKVH